MPPRQIKKKKKKTPSFTRGGSSNVLAHDPIVRVLTIFYHIIISWHGFPEWGDLDRNLA